MDHVINEISNIIQPIMQDSIQKVLENNPVLKNSDEVKQVIGWIKEANENTNVNAGNTLMFLMNDTTTPAVLSPSMSDDNISSHNAISSSSSIQNTNNMTLNVDVDSIYTKIANIIAQRLTSEIVLPFGQASVENIKIRTQGKEKQATFDVSFVMDSIKPYVSYIKKINHSPVLQLKTIFQIDSDVTLSNIGLTVKEETTPDQDTINSKKKVIGLSTMTVHGSISLLKLVTSTPIVNVSVNTDKPKTLKEFKFEADLSKISFNL